MFEQAIPYFERACLLQPKEVKWALAVASCYKKSGSHQMAYDMLKSIHAKFPDSVECKLDVLSDIFSS